MFHYVELRAFSLATEDVDRVRRALRFAAGVDDKHGIDEQSSSGFHRNPIIILGCRIERNREIDGFFKRLKDAGLVRVILTQLEDRLDEDLMLNIRLNKQDAYKESLVLASDDSAGGVISVAAKAKAYPGKRETALKATREYLEGLD